MIKYLLFISLLWNGALFSQEKAIFYFDLDQDYLNSKSEMKFTQWLQDKQQIKISRIEAYCDSTASFSYNMLLANRRAKYIKKRFENHTINIDSTAAVVAFGEDFKGATHHGIHRKVVVFYHNIIPSSEVITPSPLQIKNTIKTLELPIVESSNNLTTQLQKAEVGEFIILKNVNFKFNSEVIVDRATDILNELLRFMQLETTLKIEIQGHICCNSDPNDVKLSYRRSKAIFDFLIRSGIATKRLGYKGFGSSRPIYRLPEKNEKELAANRRVEILILQK